MEAEIGSAVLAVIPARGGSKGVPRKNLRTLGGKPLVAWSLEAALAARAVTDVLLTSDSDEILITAAAVSDRVIRLQRPARLAEDATPILPVYRHAVEEFERLRGCPAGLVVGLEPTTPFRSGADVDACVESALRQGADVLVSAKAAAENPYFVQVEARSDGSGWYAPVKKTSATRRQDAPRVFALNGGVYVFTREALFGLNHIYDAARLAVHEMPAERSIDLDTELDFLLAELLLERRLVASPAPLACP